MDTVFLRGLKLEAAIGIYRRERSTTQPIEVDLDIALPDDRVFASGKVADTIDYAQVAERLGRATREERFGLVEQMAQAFAGILIEEFRAPWVRVTIAKLGILRDAARVGITIERSAGDRPAERSAASSARPAGFDPQWQSSESPSGSNPFADSDTAP